MKRVTRLLALAGAVAAGVTAFAGPAQAAPAAGQTAAAPAAAGSKAYWGDDDYRVVGYFNTRRQCNVAGRIGEWRDRWEDYSCYPVRYGFYRSGWALIVSDDNDWDDNWRPRPGYFPTRGYGDNYFQHNFIGLQGIGGFFNR